MNGAEEVPMTSEHHQRFPKISKECQMWLYKASNLGTTLPRLRISISWQDYRGKVSGDLAEIPQKKTWHSKWCVRSSNDLQTSPKIPNDFQRMSLKCGSTKCQNLGTTLARSWYPFLVRLQRQGVRRSCWDPTCLCKITFLVNFQVNGYGTSEILLFACDWCFWSTGMWHRCNACEMAVYSTPLD